MTAKENVLECVENFLHFNLEKTVASQIAAEVSLPLQVWLMKSKFADRQPAIERWEETLTGFEQEACLEQN